MEQIHKQYEEICARIYFVRQEESKRVGLHKLKHTEEYTKSTHDRIFGRPKA